MCSPQELRPYACDDHLQSELIPLGSAIHLSGGSEFPLLLLQQADFEM
jgi:hypothetical protein